MNLDDRVSFHWLDGCVTVRLIGDLDEDTVRCIHRLVGEMVDLAKVGPTTLDLSAVTYLDSAGIGLIVGLHKRTDAVGFVVTGASSTVRHGFAVTGLDRVLHVVDGPATGLSATT